ncbi:hypothetical protein [Streptomyces sp. HNM0574]|uniref:hypothetical protein n=1 Tax=Streptomyces sp. HNM0574 TaxID=2714954 RepID=UPI001F0CFB81|nr:hypothetical protein [Streptomyces sp. HNM0574]
MSEGRAEVGAYAVDTRSGRVGEVMARTGPYAQLRPPGGGLEWDVPVEDLRPVTAHSGDELRARVSEFNHLRIRLRL